MINDLKPIRFINEAAPMVSHLQFTWVTCVGPLARVSLVPVKLACPGEVSLTIQPYIQPLVNFNWIFPTSCGGSIAIRGRIGNSTWFFFLPIFDPCILRVGSTKSFVTNRLGFFWVTSSKGGMPNKPRTAVYIYIYILHQKTWLFLFLFELHVHW